MRHVVVMGGPASVICTASTQRSARSPVHQIRQDEVDHSIRPPNGTAGFARSAVRGIRRLPSPPASTIPEHSVLLSHATR